MQYFFIILIFFLFIIWLSIDFFILTSFNAGMYNYVVEYVFNKTIKVLQDVIFSIGEDLVINITHWIDKSFISKFFDIFILRLATDFDLITKQENDNLIIYEGCECQSASLWKNEKAKEAILKKL